MEETNKVAGDLADDGMTASALVCRSLEEKDRLMTMLQAWIRGFANIEACSDPPLAIPTSLRRHTSSRSSLDLRLYEAMDASCPSGY